MLRTKNFRRDHNMLQGLLLPGLQAAKNRMPRSSFDACAKRVVLFSYGESRHFTQKAPQEKSDGRGARRSRRTGPRPEPHQGRTCRARPKGRAGTLGPGEDEERAGEEEPAKGGFIAMFQAHLILLIKERGFSNAARVAWDVTERLRKEGHEAYVASIDPPGPPAKRRRPRAIPHPASRNDPGSP